MEGLEGLIHGVDVVVDVEQAGRRAAGCLELDDVRRHAVSGPDNVDGGCAAGARAGLVADHDLSLGGLDAVVGERVNNALGIRMDDWCFGVDPCCDLCVDGLSASEPTAVVAVRRALVDGCDPVEATPGRVGETPALGVEVGGFRGHANTENDRFVYWTSHVFSLTAHTQTPWYLHLSGTLIHRRRGYRQGG